MRETAIDILSGVLILLVFGGVFASWKFRSWWKRLHSPLMKALYSLGLAADLAGAGIVILAVRRLSCPNCPPFPEGVYMLSASLIILLGTKIFLMLWLWKLDRKKLNGNSGHDPDNEEHRVDSGNSGLD